MGSENMKRDALKIQDIAISSKKKKKIKKGAHDAKRGEKNKKTNEI
jgi:hypothetical protein